MPSLLRILPEILKSPSIWRVEVGLFVPIPTLPPLLTLILSMLEVLKIISFAPRVFNSKSWELFLTIADAFAVPEVLSDNRIPVIKEAGVGLLRWRR